MDRDTGYWGVAAYVVYVIKAVHVLCREHPKLNRYSSSLILVLYSVVVGVVF